MALRRPSFAAVCIVAAITSLVAGGRSADAQSPFPNGHFLDVPPGSGYPNGWQGVIVEGLGQINCYYSTSSVETSTVNFVQMPNNTITEISPQSVCGTISQYETLISNIIQYVNAHASNAGSRWAGIMLDEEAGSASDCGPSGFGFSASQLQTLNNYAANAFSSTPGAEWFFTQDAVPTGCWNESTYENVISLSNAAPQIYTGYMASLANGSSSVTGGVNMVTYQTKNAIYQYHSETAAVRAVNGTPFALYGWNWDDKFQ